MSRVERVTLSRDAYLVCSHHVHTTDGEEVMGLLVGRYTPCSSSASESKDTTAAPAAAEVEEPDSNNPPPPSPPAATVEERVICDVTHAVILGRSDKRKDRVEISPEMLIQAQQKAEEISQSCGGASVHIVGWYHSHPKITVAPSAVDLRTQFGYQQMDNRFVGIIFSVFNKNDSSKMHEEVVGGFQAVKCGRESYERINVPVTVRPEGGIAPHNQEAVCGLSSILQQEQLAVLQQSREQYAAHRPLQHVYNTAVAVQRVVELCAQIPAPLCALLHSRTQHTRHSLGDMDAHTRYLTKLLRDKGVLEEGKCVVNAVPATS